MTQTTLLASPFEARRPRRRGRKRGRRLERARLRRRRLRRRRTRSRTPKPATPTARELHFVNRLGTGFSAESFAQLRAAGGAQEWFELQLTPTKVAESATAKALIGWFPSLSRTPEQIWDQDQKNVYQAWQVAKDLSNYSLLKRIYSNRTVFENMVELWSNHFHVQAEHFPTFTQRPAYDATIRKHALGKFSDLLVAVSLHPAMLMYLNNYRSVKGAPNENQGRELLELHTVGRGAGYTEQMVKDSAKILSGYTVVNGYSASTAPAWSGYYDPSRHTTGRVTVLGFSAANAAADGSALTVDYLRYLATHPATARRIAHKLAVRFVSDTPSDQLVTTLTQVYLDSGTDIAATLRALVASEEFWASAGVKVRTPIDDVVATCRTLRVTAQAPTTKASFAHALPFAINSTLPYHWPRPDGPPDSEDVWAAPTRMLNSWKLHWSLASGAPAQQATYRTPASYLPVASLRFDRFVDHLCRILLGQGSTSVLLDAACEGTGTGTAEVVTVDHPVIRHKFPRLVSVLLDSPEHMTR
jgi:uncharacterized protein (DUF1800 family)